MFYNLKVIVFLFGFPVLAFKANFSPSETIHIAQFPPYPRLGKPVLLFLDDNRTPTACNWFRGRDPSEESHLFRADFDSTEGVHKINRTGAAYTGREDLAWGCSLIIQKVRPSDAGPYTVSMMGLGGSGPVTGMRNLQLYCKYQRWGLRRYWRRIELGSIGGGN